MGKTLLAVLDLLRTSPTITQQEIAASLGITTNAVQKHINRLKAQGGIQRMGSPTRGGYWQVLSNPNSQL